MPGTETTDLEYKERISRSKEILVRHGFAMSAVPEIASAFNVSLRTAYRYKAQAEKEIQADIDLSDEEATRLMVDGLLEVFHTPGTKATVKLRALDMLARAKGVYRTKKIEITSPFKELTEEDIREMAEQLGIVGGGLDGRARFRGVGEPLPERPDMVGLPRETSLARLAHHQILHAPPRVSRGATLGDHPPGSAGAA